MLTLILILTGFACGTISMVKYESKKMLHLMVVFSGAGILLILASIGIEAFAAKDMVKHEGIISIERDSGVESGGLFGPEKKKDYYVFVTTSLKETRVPKEQVTIKFTKDTPYYEKKEFCNPLWDGVINWIMPSIAVKGYDEFTIKINKAMMKKLYD